MPQALKIILGCVLIAVGYGIAHDMVTAHLCVEYFSVAHPQVVNSNQPIVLALVWGVLATWWFGLIVGLVLAACARLGSWPKIDARHLLPLAILMLLCVGGVAAFTGWLMHNEAIAGRRKIPPTYVHYAQIPPEKHPAFLADVAAHNTSYAGAFIGSLTLCTLTVLRRRRAARGK